MRSTRQNPFVGIALLAMAGCASTMFESTWLNRSASPGELQGRRVGAFVLSDTEDLRRGGEDTLAAALTQHGVVGIPGYQIATAAESADPAKLQIRLQQAHVDATVQMRVVSVDRVVNYSALYTGPYWGWYGPGYGFATAGYPGYQVDTVIRVETKVYSVPDNSLLWAGVSNTTDPRRLDWMIRDVANKSISEMKRQGLVVK